MLAKISATPLRWKIRHRWIKSSARPQRRTLW
jgi:hypothetical protein